MSTKIQNLADVLLTHVNWSFSINTIHLGAVGDHLSLKTYKQTPPYNVFNEIIMQNKLFVWDTREEWGATGEDAIKCESNIPRSIRKTIRGKARLTLSHFVQR